MRIWVHSSYNEHKLSELAECIMYAKLYDGEQQGSCWYDICFSFPRYPSTCCILNEETP